MFPGRVTVFPDATTLFADIITIAADLAIGHHRAPSGTIGAHYRLPPGHRICRQRSFTHTTYMRCSI
ncbi:unnamed protein product [Boreogadus saida]